MKYIPRAMLTAAIATLLVLGGAATSATAATEWAVEPATPDGADGRVSLRHVVEPGASVADAIVVTNLGAADARFTVAHGDGVVGDSGAFDIAEGEADDAGAWITVGGLDGGELALAAGEARVLPVAIDVPADATPGDHPAGVVVGVSTGDGTSTVTTRIGVRVHLRVAGEVEPQLQLQDVATSFTPSWIPFAPGRLDVRYSLANTGNVRLGGAAEVQANGPFGVAGSQLAAQAGELLPGDEVTRSLSMDVAPLMLLFGSLEVSAIAVGEDELALPASATEEYWLFAVSWTGLGLIVVAGGLVVLWRYRVVRVAREKTPAPGQGL